MNVGFFICIQSFRLLRTPLIPNVSLEKYGIWVKFAVLQTIVSEWIYIIFY